MKIETVKISSVKKNPDNPRFINDDKFKQLVTSIKEFPEMMNIRPIVVNNDMMILGGNMRLAACLEAGIKEIPIIKADTLTQEQQREFIIKDNVGFGSWDWDLLANEWDSEKLKDWGLNLPVDWDNENNNNKYTGEIEAPTYTPSNEKPKIIDLFDDEKTKKLIDKIKNANVPNEEKEFLIKTANRHNIFNYSKIADYYAHSNAVVQELMEQSALVIIDFKKAIEYGFTKLSEDIAESFINNEK